MRRVQNSTPITDFGWRKQISFDALFSSDSEEENALLEKEVSAPVTAPLAAPVAQLPPQPSPDFPYRREQDDPISVWTQKVTESFEKASETKKQLPPDFKESLGRLSFFRKPQAQPQVQANHSVSKEETGTPTVHAE
jgi:hypothetical protein